MTDTVVALFASGTGSNAENIVRYFSGKPGIRFLIASNNPDAPVLGKAEALGVPTYVFSRQELRNGSVLSQLQARQVGYVVLAGFLWLVPPHIVEAYPNRILNIHPSLLPKFGGKGMYGRHVHEAVLAAGEKESGITIHLVNENYDEGQAVLQATCPVLPNDTPESLAAKIHALEHEHYPRMVGKMLAGAWPKP